MTKDKLIQHYEKEFEWYDNGAKSFENTNQVLYEWFNGSRVQIRNFLYQLKNLEVLSESQSVSDNEDKRKNCRGYDKECNERFKDGFDCRGCFYY